MRDFKELDVWKISREINREVYLLTKKFPEGEIYSLTSQIRRAAISVSSNIAEGCGRRTNKELIYFLHNAMGSLKELECQMFLALDLDYLDKTSFDGLNEKTDKLGKKLNVFIQHIAKEDPKL